jgi:hypothetical protein
VLFGLGLGILTGVVFGDLIAFVGIVGRSSALCPLIQSFPG